MLKKLQRARFYLSFKFIERYQRGDRILTEKLTCVESENGYFCGGQNTIKLITHKNKKLFHSNSNDTF